MRRVLSAVAVVLLGVLTLTACGGGSSSSNGADLPVKKIAITFSGDDVTPNGTDIDIKVGQPLEFDVTADKPGEIHVHSSPQQEFEYKAGSNQVISVDPIQAPGRVTVESHTLEKTLFILVAR